MMTATTRIVAVGNERKWQADATELWLHEEITRRISFFLRKEDKNWSWLVQQTGLQSKALSTRYNGHVRWSVYDVYLCADALGVRLSDLFPPLEKIQ